MRSVLRYSLFALMFLPSTGKGQTSTWDNPKGKATAGIERKKGAVKKWKEHLQAWGMDSSYNHGFFIGGRLSTNGWSGTVMYQKPLYGKGRYRYRKIPGQSRLYTISFSEVKHEKQIKQQASKTAFPELGSPSPFVFGKINNLYLLQLGYGREQMILPRVLDGNISVAFSYSGGLSLAMLKPYYLKLIHIDYFPTEHAWVEEEKYSSSNEVLFLKQDQVLGASSWSKGLSEIKYVPGVFIDGALTLEPARGKTFIQTISLGGQFSIYTKALPIMAERKAFAWQGALYVGLMLGKRWK